MKKPAKTTAKKVTKQPVKKVIKPSPKAITKAPAKPVAKKVVAKKVVETKVQTKPEDQRTEKAAAKPKGIKTHLVRTLEDAYALPQVESGTPVKAEDGRCIDQFWDMDNVLKRVVQTENGEFAKMKE